MPNCSAAPYQRVTVDNGVLLNSRSKINIDVTLPLAAAALAAAPPTIVQLDSATAPPWPQGTRSTALPVTPGVPTDASFAYPPMVGTQVYDSGGSMLYVKTAATAGWKGVAVA